MYQEWIMREVNEVFGRKAWKTKNLNWENLTLSGRRDAGVN